LAIKVGLNENTLYRIESGRTLSPSSKTRQKLSDALGDPNKTLRG
jgi:transcriptional regulator with XRE-family HTH domain